MTADAVPSSDTSRSPDIIESFESSSEDVYGDILSARPDRRPVKVGFLGCGYFEYWRMYPDTLAAAVGKDLDTVLGRLRREFDVVFPGIVDTLDRAEEAGRFFLEEKIDVLIVAEGTYVPDFITMQAIDKVAATVPVLLFSMQAEDEVDRQGGYERSLRNSGLIGTAQLSGTFRKIRRPFKLVVGSIQDERAYSRIRAFVKAVQAVRHLRDSNIGVVGHVFRGMYDLELDKTMLKGTFGANVIYIQLSHLMEEWESVQREEAGALADSLWREFTPRGVTPDDVFAACRLAIATRNLVTKYRLDALCFLDQHYIQRRTLTTARLAGSLLIERDGCMVSCEGDLGGLVMMMLMRSVASASPLLGEWGEFDVPLNAILIMGHGLADPGLARSPKEVRLTRTPENWGFQGAGTNYEFIMRPGPVSMGHLLLGSEGWQMLICRGMSVDFPCLSYDEVHAMIKLEKPVREFLECLLSRGVAHHVIVVPGDVAEELEDIANLLGVTAFRP